MACPGVALARQVFGSREPSGHRGLAGRARRSASASACSACSCSGRQASRTGSRSCSRRHSRGCSPPWRRRLGGPTLRLPPFDRRDVVAVALALLVVPLVTWAPYDHVREPVAEGEAYRAYFTADFVWAMTVTGEFARGEVPPREPVPSAAQTAALLLDGALSVGCALSKRGSVGT